jgi:dephospho-CoA kinase
MLIVGLTGGIGAGKSTVARLLEQRGAHIIDVDTLGRSVISSGGSAVRPVVSEFGESILDSSGAIDRAALSNIVFSNARELRRLTAITHPAINDEILARLSEIARDRIVVLDMAVLVESNLGQIDEEHSYTLIMTVEAPLELRIERAVNRGMQEAEVRRRMSLQADERTRRAAADYVFENDHSHASLEVQTDDAWEWLSGKNV